MNGRKGTFTVIPAGKDNHGTWYWWTENIILNMRMVPVIIRWVRRPMAWTHMKETTQEATLKSFAGKFLI